MFREGGEAQVSAYASSAGGEAQVAVAVTDQIGIIGNFAYATQTKTNPDYTRKNMFGELGLGFFGGSRAARYEIYAGYGMGQGTGYDQYYFFTQQFGPNQTKVYDAKFSRVFVQPSIGTNNRDFNFIFTPRISWVSFSEFVSEGITMKPGEGAQMFLEPAATAKFRIAGNLHGIFQVGLSTAIGESFFKNQTVQFTTGIQIDTGGLRTKVFK